ncbi:hypothetical protein BZA05DRAFT_404441 [Tricharina praecox]|uniref:uncharacterized protein n=1 Tax=Tricharina praecox TaxID=43433 RepID=UPI002220C73C|nr:uncharacterized protein BZA05DRAFT_404441 [Tricharina praecox]KAI5848103.1 hypothetical protein BZA05DRAFT_404441 [Tricharina praecox]
MTGGEGLTGLTHHCSLAPLWWSIIIHPVFSRPTSTSSHHIWTKGRVFLFFFFPQLKRRRRDRGRRWGLGWVGDWVASAMIDPWTEILLRVLRSATGECL